MGFKETAAAMMAPPEASPRPDPPPVQQAAPQVKTFIYLFDRLTIIQQQPRKKVLTFESNFEECLGAIHMQVRFYSLHCSVRNVDRYLLGLGTSGRSRNDKCLPS